MFRSKIAGIGHFLPENIVTNKSLESVMETTDEWIQERTGIKERRWVIPGDGNTTSSMGTKAARKAIKNADLTPDDIDFIVFATLSPDYYFPGPGVMVQKELGIKEVGALDVRNQCSGFIYALSVADQFIKTGMYNNILVIGSELHSGGLEKSISRPWSECYFWRWGRSRSFAKIRKHGCWYFINPLACRRLTCRRTGLNWAQYGAMGSGNYRNERS